MEEEGEPNMKKSIMTCAAASVVAAAGIAQAQDECGPLEQGLTLLIIDDETIDPGLSPIEQAASDCGVDAAVLVNDNNPVEIGNPPLWWNVNCPAGEYWLTTGQLEDEGLFAPGPNTGLNLTNYIAGTIPQNQLDEIPDITPLRNAELEQLVGSSFVGVVYDSDVSLNVKGQDFIANLQGARYGLFFFSVLDTRPPQINQDGLIEILVKVDPVPDEFCWQLFGGCPADVNGDGELSVLDFVAFQQLWQAQNDAADCDGNGAFNILDFVCYQQLFQQGCN